MTHKLFSLFFLLFCGELENKQKIMAYLLKPNDVGMFQWSMINYLTLDILVYLHNRTNKIR